MNEVFTMRQAMKEDDRMDFVATMEKEIREVLFQTVKLVTF